MELESNREFWDTKARENPYWYVSSYGSFRGRSEKEFWTSGPKIWEDLKAKLRYAPQPGDVVVEIGCGVGRLTRAIAPEVSHVHALDLSPEMLALARKHGLPNVTFHKSDGSSLQPLPDACAQLTLAYCVFQHLPSLQLLSGYLEEMARVTEPGGILAFTLTPRTWSVHLLPLLKLRRRLVELVVADGPRGLYRDEWVGISPSVAQVRALSPQPLTHTALDGSRWLFHCRTGVEQPMTLGDAQG